MKSSRLLVAALATLALLSGAYAAENPSVLIPGYEKISAALVADNCRDAKSAAQELAEEATQGHENRIAAAAQAVAKAADLTAAREAFKQLSVDIIPVARHQAGHFIVNCPMANADWVQSNRKIANPYFGAAMSSCGSVTEETKG